MIRCGFLISVGVSLIWIMKNNDVNEAIENFASHAQTNWMVDFWLKAYLHTASIQIL